MMFTNRLGQTLALGVMAVAIFGALEALSMPVPGWRLGTPATITLTMMLVVHACLYWWGEQARARFGLAAYVVAQAAVLSLVAFVGALYPIGLALYMALTVEIVIVAGNRWGSVPITFGAVALFGATAIATSNLYRGARAGLVLAITGVLAHAIAALVRRREVLVPVLGVAQPAGIPSAAPRMMETTLTPREVEVLQILSTGARTNDIAARLGITERTVKAHLASIYQKLGVDSRTAAVALALQRKIVAGKDN